MPVPLRVYAVLPFSGNAAGDDGLLSDGRSQGGDQGSVFSFEFGLALREREILRVAAACPFRGLPLFVQSREITVLQQIFRRGSKQTGTEYEENENLFQPGGITSAYLLQVCLQMFILFVFFRVPPGNGTGGNADGNAHWRDITGHDRASADDAAVSDRHSGHDVHPAADPDIVLDHDGLRLDPLFPDRLLRIIEPMVSSDDHAMSGDPDAIADPDLSDGIFLRAVTDDHRIILDGGILSDLYISGDDRSGSHKTPCTDLDSAVSWIDQGSRRNGGIGRDAHVAIA